MLRRNSSDNHLFMKPKMDTVMKHKIRNLRAKLKTLLSRDSCLKLSKRQKIVRKMESSQNKYFYQTNTQFNRSKHLFTFSKQQPKQFWYSEKNKCNVMNAFGKLTTEEIQQIKEDMMYYLGQQNIEKFKLFEEIKGLKKSNKQNIQNPLKRLKTLISQSSQNHINLDQKIKIDSQRKQSECQSLPRFQKNCSINENFFNYRQSFQSNQTNKLSNPSKKRLKTANLIQSRVSTLTKRSNQKQKLKFQANYLGNRQNFLNKRRVIQEEQNAQRIITKMNMQMKQQKAIDLFKITQDVFLSTIKQKNNVNDSKTKRILHQKYKKNVTFGSIVELNQELRKIYIKKITSNVNTNFSLQKNDKIADFKDNYDSNFNNVFTSASHFNYKY